MIFFISNAIETQLITTGAFEIYLNGKSYQKLVTEIFLIYKYYLEKNRHADLVKNSK